MIKNDLKNILARLEIEETGRYENHFYVVNIENSDEYAKMYTKLSKNAIDTEYPTFGTRSFHPEPVSIYKFRQMDKHMLHKIFSFL